MSILQLTPNVPVEIALKFPDGKLVEGRYGDQMMYSLMKPADHVIYLDNDVAARLNVLEPRKGEVVMACKRWSGKKGDKPQWDFWRAEEGARQAPATNIEHQLRASIKQAQERKALDPLGPDPPEYAAGANVSAPAPAPTASTQSVNTTSPNGTKPNGNGTNGYANGRAVNPHLPVPPTKVPMNVAVIEAVEMVREAMQYTGEQWSDQSRQDLVSTILIQAGKEGWLSMWERGPK